MTLDPEMQAYLAAARRLISGPGFEALLLTPNPKKRRLRDDEDPRPFRDDENLLAPPTTRELAAMQVRATRVVQAREELARARQRLELAISNQHNQPLASDLLALMWEKVIRAAKMVDRPARGRPKGTTFLSAKEIEGYRRTVEEELGRPPTQDQVVTALQLIGRRVSRKTLSRIYCAQFGSWPRTTQ